MALGEWQVDVQKASAKTEGGVALPGKQEVAVTPSGRIPRVKGTAEKGFSILAVLTIAWPDPPRFAKKELIECKQCLKNHLLGAEMWGHL